MNETDSFANYSGDQSHIIYDAPKGPDYEGRYWRAIEADYDEAANKTRVWFAEIEAAR